MKCFASLQHFRRRCVSM